MIDIIQEKVWWWQPNCHLTHDKLFPVSGHCQESLPSLPGKLFVFAIYFFYLCSIVTVHKTFIVTTYTIITHTKHANHQHHTPFMSHHSPYIIYVTLFPTHHLRYTIPHIPFTLHHSPLTFPYTPLTPHYSPHTIYVTSFLTHLSPHH